MERAAAASMKDMPVYKDYGDGMKWVELKLPEKLTPEQTKGVREASENEAMEYKDNLPDYLPIPPGPYYTALNFDKSPIKNNFTQVFAVESSPERAHLAGRLAEEGNQMGHCVGTHCDYYDGVMNGSKQIFSLRDANNVPHVTIETNIKRNLDRWLNANKETIANDPELSKMLFTDDFDSKYPRSVRDDEDLANDYIGNITKIMKEKGLPINEDPSAYVNIKQVKGNKNSRPKEPYQNYVTDFIQKNPTGHEIVDINELHNTNLMNVNDVAHSGIVPKEIHFHPDVEKAMTSFYPAFKNLMAADKEELTYRLFKTAAKDLSRQNKPYFTGEDLLENIRNKYLPKPK
jgi:hypothetical protein